MISAMDGSLPKKPCKTCKNKFHAGCLYKVRPLHLHSLLFYSNSILAVVQFEPLVQLPVVPLRDHPITTLYTPYQQECTLIDCHK